MQIHQEQRNRKLYLDILKSLAIIAVLVDHFRGLFDDNNAIASLSYFSVSTFVVCAGVLSQMSLHRYFLCIERPSMASYIVKRSKSLICTYIVASTICFLLHNANRVENIMVYFDSLVSFNNPLPSYYVIVHIQLLVISPVLYALINKGNRSRFPAAVNTILLIMTLLLGYYLTLHGPVLPYYGGGGVLLTGSYLFLFTVGMLFGEYDGEKRLAMLKYANILVLPALIWSGYCVAKNQWIMSIFPAWIINPPNVVIMMYALLLSWIVTAAVHFSGRKIQKYILKPFSIFGRYSLDIFLFHIPLQLITWPLIDRMGFQSALSKILKFCFPLILPIMIRFLYERTKKWIVSEFKVE